MGGFVVEALIGVGGMGEVYRALQVNMGRPVALKVLAPDLCSDASYVRRFRQEARWLRDLEHPAIVPVLDAGEDGGLLYVAMRLLAGGSLASRLNGAPLPPGQALDLLTRLASAVDSAHSRGVIHRDLKPANILFDNDGQAYVADFGIARAVGEASDTTTGLVLGTPRYMAPEQAGPGVSHRSDLYAFGCIAMEVLSGSPPFLAEDPVALLVAHAHDEPPRARSRNAALPAAVDGVLRRALAKRPLDRYPSAGALVDDLRAALGNGSGYPGLLPAVTRQPELRPAGQEVRRAGGARTVPQLPARWRRVRAAAVSAAAAGVLGATVLLARPLAGPPAAGADARPSAPGSSASATAPPAASGAPPPDALPDVSTAELAAESSSGPAGGDLVQPDSDDDALGGLRGARLYEAILDGTDRSFQDAVGRVHDPAHEEVRFLPGAVELVARTPGADASTDLAVGNLTTFVGDLEFSVEPGTDVRFCWSLRWDAGSAYLLCLETLRETTAFQLWDGRRLTPLSEAAPVPGLQEGRAVRPTVVVAASRLSLYLDGRLLLDVEDDSIPPSPTIPGLEVDSSEGIGTVRVTAIRISALTRPTASP